MKSPSLGPGRKLEGVPHCKRLADVVLSLGFRGYHHASTVIDTATNTMLVDFFCGHPNRHGAESPSRHDVGRYGPSDLSPRLGLSGGIKEPGIPVSVNVVSGRKTELAR